MNFLMSFADFFAKGGPLMWPILLCSVLALAIVLFKTLEYTTALHTLGKIKQGDSIPLPWFLAPICERLGTADEETLSLTANRQVRKLERGLGMIWMEKMLGTHENPPKEFIPYPEILK